MSNEIDTRNVIVGGGELEVDDHFVGMTEDGVTAVFERAYYDHECDQKIGILQKFKIGEVLRISTTMQEATLENIKIAWGIAHDIDGNGTKSLSFGGDSEVPEHKLTFRGKGPDGNQRTYTVYKAVSIETGEHTYSRTGKVAIPVAFQALLDLDMPDGKQYGNIADEPAE